jgi:hypothetical protein
MQNSLMVPSQTYQPAMLPQEAKKRLGGSVPQQRDGGRENGSGDEPKAQPQREALTAAILMPLATRTALVSGVCVHENLAGTPGGN